MNWLDTFESYTSKHESPSIYHMWTGISTIASVLERKVWTQLMFDKIYPNMYIIFVGPAGRCRKGSAMAMGTRLLRKIKSVNLCANIITKEALIHKMTKGTNSFEYNSKIFYHSSVTAVSSELDIVISSDRVPMLKLFTDIFDSQHHDKYEMETIKRGPEHIEGLWFHLFGATTPEFFRSKEMALSVAGGFTSRCVYIYAEDRRFRSEVFITDKKRRKIQFDQDKKYFNILLEFLIKIHELSGPFHFSDRAGEEWNSWYQKLEDESPMIAPLQPYWERRHVHVIKLAMVLAVSENQDKLIIHHRHIINAIGQIKMAEKYMPLVFSGTGRSLTAQDMDKIMRYLKRKTRNKFICEKDIFNDHWRDIRVDIVQEILNDLATRMKLIDMRIGKKGAKFYKWIEEKEGERR